MKLMLCAVFASALALESLDAQPRCKKGIPCGNSCISATKVCRIGSADPPPPPPPSSPILPMISPRSLYDSSTQPQSMWVGSVDGEVYYYAGCPTAAKLTPDERIYFKSEEQARAARYRRSRAKGC
jgi:hypothetical protein